MIIKRIPKAMSLNKYRNEHWAAIHQQKAEFVMLLRIIMQEQGIAIAKLKTPIKTIFSFYDYRGRDIDGEIISIKNFHDALCDPIDDLYHPRSGLGMIHDDKRDEISAFEVRSIPVRGNYFDVEIIEDYKIDDIYNK